MDIHLFIGLAVGGAGLVFLVVGLVLILMQLRKMRRCTETAIGQLEWDGLFRRAKVLYQADGQQWRFTINTRGGRPLYRQQLSIYYNPDNPKDAYLKGNTDFVHFFVGGLFVFLGLVFAVAGVVLLRVLPLLPAGAV